MFIFKLLTEALTKAVFCTFRPKYLLLVLYFITVTVGVFLFALSFELYIPILNTYRTAVSPTLDLLCHEDFNVGRSEAESNIEIFMAQ